MVSMLWLQEEGAAVSPLGRRGASAVARVARSADQSRALEPMVCRTSLWGVIQLDLLHAPFGSLADTLLKFFLRRLPGTLIPQRSVTI
jgi:hypothetical protein